MSSLGVNNNPGPGAYKTSYSSIFKKSPYIIIGNEQRPELTSKDIMNTPGPNNYLPNISTVKRTSANWTIQESKIHESLSNSSGKKESPSLFNTPGPGSYNINVFASSELKKAPRAFLAGKNISTRLKNVFPSPLEYSPSLESIKRKSPTHKIGSSL